MTKTNQYPCVPRSSANEAAITVDGLSHLVKERPHPLEGTTGDLLNRAVVAFQLADPCLHTARDLYAHYPEGIARSKLTNALIEKTLKARGTARNWNTLNKLLQACSALD